MRSVPVEVATRYEEQGWWTRDTLGDMLAGSLEGAPGVAFTVHSEVRPWSGTFRDVERVARRLAAGLRARSGGPGDVVAFQLPNWMEAAATFWASDHQHAPRRTPGEAAYETQESLTKYLPEQYKDVIQYVQVNGRTKIAIRGHISDYIPNPTFEVVARPGAMEEYFNEWRPVQDAVASWVIHGALFRC